MYKIDNIYQKAKIKNLEFGISKKQCWRKEEKEKKNKTQSKNYIYMKFAEEEKKIGSFFFFYKVTGYKSEN